MYKPRLFPFKFHCLGNGNNIVIGCSGDFSYLTNTEIEQLLENPLSLPHARLAELKSKYIIGSSQAKGTMRLLASRIHQKKETILSGPSLHAIVPTLHCEHTCTYCQVSRSLREEGRSLSIPQIDLIVETIFESPSKTLTVEFQGGDPLLRYDLVRAAIQKVAKRNKTECRNLRFVVSSTLHQLTEEMCRFFSEHQVYLSTSIDGPPDLHNKHRLLRSRDAYERTIEGIALARKHLGRDSVSALMTTTKSSLGQPQAIVDEYVKLGLKEIFIRPISMYGFAKRNEKKIGYSNKEFLEFYKKAFERVLYWNREGYPLREVSAAIVFNKVLSSFDAGYVDLQTPSGAGLACLVYNYDGFIYPSDESRMLAETGDKSLRLGKIGNSLGDLLSSPVIHQLVEASLSKDTLGCQGCAFSVYCGPDPVEAYASFGSMKAPVHLTNHCTRYFDLFDYLFRKLDGCGPWFADLACSWAQP